MLPYQAFPTSPPQSPLAKSSLNPGRGKGCNKDRVEQALMYNEC